MTQQYGPAMTVATTSDRELLFTRVVDAPRTLVWEAYTRPEHIPHWWGLRRHATRVDEMDVRPGGAWRYVERAADGTQHAFRGRYLEVAPPQHLVSTFEYEGAPGLIVHNAMTLEERDGKTVITVVSRFQTPQELQEMQREGMEAGAAESWDRLAEYLATLRPHATAPDLVIVRTFNAPRHLVWQAWTDPRHMARWWGPAGYTLPVCKIDLRVGGSYFYCMRSPDGQDIWATGVYREVVPHQRLVMTDSFADPAGNVVPATQYGMGADIPLEMLLTVTFEELDGNRTRMTLRHAGLPAGDMLQGAGIGWGESFDKLAEALAAAPQA